MKTEDYYFLACVAAFVVVGVTFKLLQRARARRRRKPASPPPLWQFSPDDPFTTANAFEHLLAFGGSGSGKTSTLMHLMRQMFLHGWGMLFLPSKGSDVHDVVRLARETGRSGDLVIVRPGSPHAFDFLTHEIEVPGGGIGNANSLLTQLMEVITRTNSKSGHDPFWGLAAARLTQAAMVIIHWATGQASVVSIYRFITSLPHSLEMLATPEWQASYCARMLFAAKQKPGWDQDVDLELATEFILRELPRMGERTLGSVLMNAHATISHFISADIRSLVSGPTKAKPEMAFDGKIVIVDTPPLVFGERGRALQLIWKLSFARASTRRVIGPGSLPACLWQDEYALHAVPSVDTMLQAVARSHWISVIAAIQNFPLLEKSMESKEEALALLGNFATIMWFANNCSSTNELASQMLPSSKHLYMSGSSPTGPFDFVADWLGLAQPDQKQGSAGFNEQWHPDVPPSDFTKLFRGSHAYGKLVQAIVFAGGRRFSDGRTWKKCTFAQM